MLMKNDFCERFARFAVGSYFLMVFEFSVSSTSSYFVSARKECIHVPHIHIVLLTLFPVRHLEDIIH